jgi:energy-coupling factor transporter transmembrane protein EcfT
MKSRKCEIFDKKREKFYKNALSMIRRGEFLDPILIILILIGALILLAVARFVGRALKIIIYIMLFIIIIFAVLSFMAYNDFTQLKKGLYEHNNTFILYDNNTLYAAVTLKPITNLSFTLESFNYFTAEELEKIKDAVQKENYSYLTASNYKLFLVKPAILDHPFKLNLITEIDEKDILTMITSDKPYNVLAKKLVKTYNSSEEGIVQALEYDYGPNERIKGYLFAALLMNYYQAKNSSIIDDIRQGRLAIIPEMPSIGLLKRIPLI